MPAKLTTRKQEHQPAAEQEQAAPVARRPRLEADEAEPVETGRPHQAFVEREARKYWEDMVQPGSLAKPEQQELRAAAMPILLRALRNRGDVRFLPPTVKAHMAVNAMHLRAAERGELTRTYNWPYPVDNPVDALIQYMADARLAPRPIPLPVHDEPKHPTIYYYIDPLTRQPTPREDALLRAEYVRSIWLNGRPVSDKSHIYPSTDPDGGPPPEVVERKSDVVYYRLRIYRGGIKVGIFKASWREGEMVTKEIPLSGIDFNLHYVSPPWMEPHEDEFYDTLWPFRFVFERRIRNYWEDMVEPGSLAKPDQQKLRAVAMPILIQGLRRRSGAGILPPTIIAHLAVDIMHQRAAERGETTEPYTGPYPSLDYTEALIQYAEDTRLLPQEIPLPEHEGPQHPPIYYYIDPITRQPTPREDALIRAEYVRDPRNAKPVTEASHVHPSTDRYGQPPPEVVDKKSDIYYRLSVDRGETKTGICRIIWRGQEPEIAEKPLSYYDFTVAKKVICSLM